MTPYKCQVVHNPKYGFHGDCLRACIASILDMEPETVPHFYQDGCSAVEGERRISDFLRSRQLGYFCAYFPGDVELDALLKHVAEGSSPDVHQILICSVNGGNHAVLISGGKIVHDPALYIVRNYEATDLGIWVVMALVKL